MRAPSYIVKRPLLTEKGTRLKETGGLREAPAEGVEFESKLLFEVAMDSNKVEIRHAIERLFNVQVVDVHTAVIRGKWKRMGRWEGRRPTWKKAVVTLAPGQTIDFFEGV
ncbi:MAG TPA: 50S ribosomal protein L23 [Polyangia bacterium]|jgi:large subunit ribosomal protein L23